MNKRFRFLFFSPLLLFLFWALTITQDSSADGSIDDEIRALELKKAAEGKSKAEPKEVEPKTIKPRIVRSKPLVIVEDDSERDPSEEWEGEEGEEFEFVELEPPDWIKPARWFRSNAAGMALEEVPSRFTVLRNEYALVIDFINADELPEILTPFYEEDQYIEVRALYHNKQESRRQWIFRDEDGTSRVVAVLREIENTEKTEKTDSDVGDPAIASDSFSADDTPTDVLVTENVIENNDTIEDSEKGLAIANNDDIENVENAEDEFSEWQEDYPTIPAFTGKLLVGFVELYNEDQRLAKDIIFSGNNGTTYTDYFYRKGTLVRAEFREGKIEDGVEKTKKLFTDDYRYNRSGSLRLVERVYHEQTEGFVSLNFPHRVLDAVRMEFIAEKLYIAPEFFGSFTALPDQRLVFGTDDRGRILTQTLFDEENEVLWTIVNNWKGDRITSAVKTQGDDIWLVEYEYDSGGKRLVERNLRNGVLERQVRAEGKTEVEELMMNGIVVLRAVWEDGRKISESRLSDRRDRLR